MGLFDDIDEAESSKGGFWFKPGHYRVKLLRVFKKMSRKNVELLVVETEVLKTNNPERPVGCKPSQLYPGDKDASPGNIKGFFGVCFATQQCMNGKFMTPEQAELKYLTAAKGDAEGKKKVKARCDHAAGEDNPLEDLELNAEVFNVKTKAGGDYTKVVWSIPEDVAAQAAA